MTHSLPPGACHLPSPGDCAAGASLPTGPARGVRGGFQSPTGADVPPAAPVSQPQRFPSLALGLAVSFGLALAASPLWAQTQNCGPHAGVADGLMARYGEVRVAMGLTANGMMMETYASADTGTWTIVVTDTHGMSCLIASGTDWDDTDSKPGVDG